MCMSPFQPKEGSSKQGGLARELLVCALKTFYFDNVLNLKACYEMKVYVILGSMCSLGIMIPEHFVYQKDV